MASAEFSGGCKQLACSSKGLAGVPSGMSMGGRDWKQDAMGVKGPQRWKLDSTAWTRPMDAVLYDGPHYAHLKAG